MKKSSALLCSTLTLLLAASAYSAHASGEPMARAELVSKSELIVIGKLHDRKELDATWATATLTIHETLKGDATIHDVTLKFLAKPGSTATWTYTGDEDGIWFIKKDGDGEKPTWSTFYAGGRIPTSVPSDEGKKEIAAALVEIKKLIAEQQEAPPPKAAAPNK